MTKDTVMHLRSVPEQEDVVIIPDRHLWAFLTQVTAASGNGVIISQNKLLLSVMPRWKLYTQKPTAMALLFNLNANLENPILYNDTVTLKRSEITCW